eukprot:8097969-Alexandrium_andersonii.AAC.1
MPLAIDAPRTYAILRSTTVHMSRWACHAPRRGLQILPCGSSSEPFIQGKYVRSANGDLSSN